MMDNGVANQSDRESMEVELLNARQKEIELKASRVAFGRMLSALIGKPVPLSTAGWNELFRHPRYSDSVRPLPDTGLYLMSESPAPERSTKVCPHQKVV